MPHENSVHKTPQRIIELLKTAAATKSQKEIALESGLSESQISRYLHGRGVPNLENLQKLADYFGETFVLTIAPRKAPIQGSAPLVTICGEREGLYRLLDAVEKANNAAQLMISQALYGGRTVQAARNIGSMQAE